MRGLQKSKRVSWASDVNLCQVRLFLSDESPSQVGFGAQDHLQAKASWMPSSSGLATDDNLPPGFEAAHSANLLKNKLSQIPLVKWRCPARFVLDASWQVVAGEESKEVDIQNQREMRMLEAVYPRPSAIPPNPSVSMDTGDPPYNDLNTTLIPITPIEDEDAAADAAVDPVAQNASAMSSQVLLLPPGMPPASQFSTTASPNLITSGNTAAGIFPGLEPDVAAAAYAALSAVVSSNDQGNLIDPDLLVKILSDPKLIEKLVADHRAATNPQITPMPRPPGIIFSEPPSVQISRAEAGAPSLSVPPTGPFYGPPNRAGPVPNARPPPLDVLPVASPLGAPIAKDINYYKSLIQQHGAERQENLLQFDNRHSHQLVAHQESVNNPKPREFKPKIMKPCIYFNSSRGCRHGANCSYQHDTSSQQRAGSVPEVQSTKRMKLDREITGA
ncbi:zinc finger CCCH domain-containing protein 6 [Diospyros lotus]|uniref:zinc finger CCCH domain-containing protein 6 n=1 Tax=Diospyros lotus TaxID=55363 RepID=UPI002258D54E|nr:zinc finger CCCH domain-containing protein 6 [Diospyros lotus]